MAASRLYKNNIPSIMNNNVSPRRFEFPHLALAFAASMHYGCFVKGV